MASKSTNPMASDLRAGSAAAQPARSEYQGKQQLKAVGSFGARMATAAPPIRIIWSNSPGPGPTSTPIPVQSSMPPVATVASSPFAGPSRLGLGQQRAASNGSSGMVVNHVTSFGPSQTWNSSRTPSGSLRPSQVNNAPNLVFSASSSTSNSPSVEHGYLGDADPETPTAPASLRWAVDADSPMSSSDNPEHYDLEVMDLAEDLNPILADEGFEDNTARRLREEMDLEEDRYPTIHGLHFENNTELFLNRFYYGPQSIKTPKGRGFGRSTAQPSAPVFNPISGNAGQTNGLGSSFGTQAQGAGFDMSFPSGNTGGAFGGTNNQSQGYSGSMFSIPSAQTQPQAAPSSQPSMFSSPSSFNFGGGPLQQQQSSTGFTFGQQPQPNGTANNTQINGQSEQPVSMFGASNPAQTQAPFGGFSTPAAQQNNDPFGLKAAAPQTAPAQSSNPFGAAPQSPSSKPFSFSIGGSQAASQTSDLFGTGSQKPSETTAPKPTFTFGTSQADPPTPAPAFNSQQQTTQSSPGDQSMTSPQQQEAAKAPFGIASSSQPTPSLFDNIGQNKAPGSSSAVMTPVPAAKTPSLFSGFGSTDQPEAPAASLDKPASSLFTPASSAPAKSGSLFDAQPTSKFPSNFFSPATTPAQGPASIMFSPSKPQDAPPSIFSAPKPSDSGSSAQTPKPSAPLFTNASLTPASKSQASSGFLENPRESSTSHAQEQSENGSIFNAPSTSMSTLNSAASPAPVQKARNLKELNFKVPPPPDYFNEEERHQWHWIMQLRSLDTGVLTFLKNRPEGSVDRVAIYEWAAKEAQRMTENLKRGPADAGNTHEDAPTAKRTNFGDKTRSAHMPSSENAASSSEKAGSNLFSASNPFAPSTSAKLDSNMFAVNNASKTVTPSASSMPSNLFASANNPFTAAPGSSNKRKSDGHVDREREDGSLDSSKKSRVGEASEATEQVSYPKLPDSSSKTSQLFASISGGSSQDSSSLPKNSIQFQAPNTATPFGSPSKAPTAEKQAASAGSSLSLPTFKAPAASTDFFSQFAKTSEQEAAKAAEKRKDEDFDSEDDDEEEWARKDREAEEKKKAAIAEAAKKAPSFVFNPSATPSRTPSPFKTSESVFQKPAVSAPAEVASSLPGSLLNRTTTDANGNLVRDEAALSKSKDGGLFGASTTFTNAAGCSVFDGADKPAFAGFGTPAKPTDSASKPSSSLFSSSTNNPSSSLFANFGTPKPASTSSSAQDNTFKGDGNTPIKFSATPSINFTASTPEKTASTNGTSSKLFGGGSTLFSKSVPASSTTGGTSLFAKNPLSQSLAPSSVTSETSRATSPGTTGDEGDDGGDAGEKDAQVNLSAATAGEEDEDVLIDIEGRGQVLVPDPENAAKKKWDLRGRGQIKLLRHKNTNQTRIVLRTSPAGKIVLNTNLIPKATYTLTLTDKGNNIRFLVYSATTRPETWTISIGKDKKVAEELHKLIEDNKDNVTA